MIIGVLLKTIRVLSSPAEENHRAPWVGEIMVLWSEPHFLPWLHEILTAWEVCIDHSVPPVAGRERWQLHPLSVEVSVEDEEEASPLAITLLAGIELIAERPDVRIIPLRAPQIGANQVRSGTPSASRSPPRKNLRRCRAGKRRVNAIALRKNSKRSALRDSASSRTS